MAAEHDTYPLLPFSIEGINSKVAKLEKARSHVVEVFRLAEEIEDDCYEPYCENGFDSDPSPRAL
eukprot:1282056-Prorocentrum_lima.AAC.1